ncbi:MAG: T9SS type A sorting domain-containing protein, partial [Chitinophagales bacterium]
TLLPNPADDQVTIYLSESAIGNNLRCYNAVGELLFTQSILDVTMQLQIENLAAGLYFIAVDGYAVQQFVKN